MVYTLFYKFIESFYYFLRLFSILPIVFFPYIFNEYLIIHNIDEIR